MEVPKPELLENQNGIGTLIFLPIIEGIALSKLKSASLVPTTF